MNSCHNQEENDRNSDVALDTPQSELPSLDVIGTARKSVLTAPDGTEWLQITSCGISVGRCTQQNILREISRSTPCTKRNVFAGSPVSLLIDDFILKHIAKCTVTEAHRQLQDETFALIIEELETFIAVMYARGAAGKSALICMTFGLKIEVCLYAKALRVCPETDFVKFSGSFVLM